MFSKKEKASSDDFDNGSLTVTAAQAGAADAVFGEAQDGGPNYKNVGWIRASVLLMKAQIGLGVLGIPQVFSTVGLIPGVIILVFIAAMTTWSSLVVGKFKMYHPEVHSIADVGYMWGGVAGREFLGAIFWIYMICISGSGMLGVSIALNTLSEHGACTVVFVVVAAIAIFLLSSIRTLDQVSFLGWIGVASIMAGILTVTIAVGLQDRPAAAPAAPAPWDKNFQLFGSPTWAEAGAALGTVVFAFGGTPAFFTVCAEMRNPRDFPKTVLLCQSFVTLVYVVIGVVVYVYCGDYVASPALGSAGPLLQKISYGLALPALIIGSVIYTHLPAKYMFVRILRGSRHLSSNSFVHWGVWLGTVAFCTIIAFVIAEGVPVFSGLIGLVGALFGTIMSMEVMGGMWLYDYWPQRHEERRKNVLFKFLVGWNGIVLIMGGALITVLGTYGSIKSIIDTYAGQELVAFSCADNSGL